MSKEKDVSNIKQENLSASNKRKQNGLSEYVAVMLVFIVITSCGLITRDQKPTRSKRYVGRSPRRKIFQ